MIANNNKNSYIVQIIRKSQINSSKYMAGYINSMLNNLPASSNVTINIDGGCWSTKSNTASDLVTEVFKSINFKSMKINLINGYKSNSYDNTYIALSNLYKNLPVTISKSGTTSDHSKVFEVIINDECVFLMIGSTNFSKNQYLTPDRYKRKLTDQTEVVFIKINSITAALIPPFLTPNNNLMFNSWLEETLNDKNLDIADMNLNNENDSWYSINNESNFITLPYESNTELELLNINNPLLNLN